MNNLKIKKTSFFKAILLVIAIISLNLSTYAQSDQFIINGKLKGIPEGAKIELLPAATHRDELPVATAIVKKGNFILKGSTRPFRLYSLKVAGSYGDMKIMLDNKKMNLTGKVVKENEKAPYNFDDVKLIGSNANDEFIQKTAYRAILNRIYIDNQLKHKQTFDAMAAAKRNGNRDAADSISRSSAWSAFTKDDEDFFYTVEKTSTDAFMKEKDTQWGPLLVLHALSYISPEQSKYYDAFSEAAKNSYYGKIMGALVHSKKLDGEMAPAFELTNEKNEKVTFAMLSKGKKYILLDFWASWCAPCRKSIPAMKKLHGEFAAKGFGIVSISIDENKSDWEKAEKEEKLVWPSFLDHGTVKNIFNVKAIPTLFIVDSNGKVVKEFMGFDGVENELKELFK